MQTTLTTYTREHTLVVVQQPLQAGPPDSPGPASPMPATSGYIEKPIRVEKIQNPTHPVGGRHHKQHPAHDVHAEAAANSSWPCFQLLQKRHK
ncbi:hypothetical protein QCA50_016456 [Cerrena zonata]|uniref:Uncharacterized protein n=1 Tax=Cerrena zonata TaxID=2478898 RepID=A0AAW0FHB0_9APHY